MDATPDLPAILARAEAIARAGGAVLLEHRREHARVASRSKGQRRELVTAADRAAETAVVQRLLAEYPQFGVLAEEGVLTPQGTAHIASDGLWIVDPLDGTTNFVHGIPFYCVALALSWKGEIVLGVVHAPELGTTYTAARGLGAFRDGAKISVSSTAELEDSLLATGFSYVRNEPGKDDNLARIASVLPRCRDLRRLGSAELDLCSVAAGIYDAYWELYLAPYDVAAGAVIVREAGGTVTDLAGGKDWLHGGQVLASNALLHEELLRLVGTRK